MRTFLSILALMCIAIAVNAQSPGKSVALKTYTNAVIGQEEHIGNAFTYENFTHTSIRVGYFTPAVSWQTKAGNLREVELSRFDLYDSRLVKWNYGGFEGVIGEETDLLSISVRAEHSFRLNKKNKDAPVRTYLGVAFRPGYSNRYFESYISPIVPVRSNIVELNLAVVPRVNFDLGERLFMDINLPVTVVDYEWVHKRIFDPNISISNQDRFNSEIAAFPPKLHLRVGLGVRL